MEMPSAFLKDSTASFGSDAHAREKTLEFTQLYVKFRQRIYSYIYRLLGNQQDADDATQEVFVTVYLTWDGLDARDNLSALLYRIATNLCIDMLRRRKRISWWPLVRRNHTGEQLKGDEEISYLPSDAGGIPEVAEREYIQRTFSHLPKGYALPLLLSASRGMHYKEIAVIFGIS